MNNSINSGSCWRAFAALLFIGAILCSLSAPAASDPGSSNPGSGNAGGGYVGSGTSGGPSPSGNAGGGGSGGCRVINGPVKFVPISTTTETQRIKVGSGNSNSPGDTYLVQERTVTMGEYQMVVYTTCTCDNTHQKDTSSSTVVVGTDTRYSSWKTISVERE